MFLKIYYENEIYTYDPDETFCITKSYGGQMSLQFDISPYHEVYKYLRNETKVEYGGQRYLVKQINERRSISTINCTLDLTGLNSVVFSEFYTPNGASFSEVCKNILPDTGWKIVGAESVTKKTILRICDPSVFDIIEYCTNPTVFNTCYSYDTINKIIYCINPLNINKASGTYFTDDLNMSEPVYKGNSNNIVTKLYAFGKDRTTIASITGGKNYVENYSYTSDTIAKIWRDERYTNPQSLYDDAVAKLAKLAVPEESYTAKVIDLAKIKPETYGGILPYDLYDIITLIDKRRNTHINFRIVEIKEFPKNPTKNTVTFSNSPTNISKKISAINNEIKEINTQLYFEST